MLYIGLFPSIPFNPGFSREIRAYLSPRDSQAVCPLPLGKELFRSLLHRRSLRLTVFSRKRTVETHRTPNLGQENHWLGALEGFIEFADRAVLCGSFLSGHCGSLLRTWRAGANFRRLIMD